VSPPGEILWIEMGVELVCIYWAVSLLTFQVDVGLMPCYGERAKRKLRLDTELHAIPYLMSTV